MENSSSHFKKVIVIALVAVVVILGIKFLHSSKNEEAPVIEVPAKSEKVIKFGKWNSDIQREILGTVASSQDVQISSQVSGTLDQVLVNIGDMVREGDLLANFKQDNDITQISYESALNNLESAKITGQNMVRSAELSLDSAKRELAQTRQAEAQNYKMTFDLLRTQAQTAETTFNNALDWADRILGASEKFRYSIDTDRVQIGSNDSIGRQDAKNFVESLVQERAYFTQSSVENTLTDEAIIRKSELRLKALEQAQSLVRALDTMIRKTPSTSSFSDATRAGFQAESEGFSARVDGAILTLKAQIEAAKSEQKRNDFSILSAENRVKDIAASLELTKANADAQIVMAQNQVALTQKSKKDLEVRAPFDGKITARSVNGFDQVQVGQPLFFITDKNYYPLVWADVTADDYTLISENLKQVQILFADGQKLPVSKVDISGKMDSDSQKMEVQFEVDKLPENILVGSFAKILIPVQGKNSNLLPISSVSFEPDGAEVLILNLEMKAERKKVKTGKIISDSIEVLSGLKDGDSVLQFRNRAHAGEKIDPLQS